MTNRRPDGNQQLNRFKMTFSFGIVMLLTETPTKDMQHKTADPVEQPKRSKILIVDDHPEMLRMLASALRAGGYQVWEADSGVECLRQVRVIQPDLVLVDVVMPGLDGLEVCRRIKSDPALAHVHVALISAQATAVDHKIAGKDVGAEDYIAKPLPLDELLARVNTLVSNQKNEAALRPSNREPADFEKNPATATAMTWVGADGKILWANRALLDMLGYPREEFVGLPIATFHTNPAAVSDILHRLESDEWLNNYETWLRAKDGSTKHVGISATTNRETGQQTYRRFFIRGLGEHKQSKETPARAQEELEKRLQEMTAQLAEANEKLLVATRERQRAEEALRSSEERFRLATRATNDSL